MATRENKFKAFFRSRSRPSHPPPPDPDPDPDPDLSRPRRPSSSDNPPSSYLKSSVRSQTRPISSTTTATHSTITPLPSDALRNRSGPPRHAYAYQQQTTRDHDQSTDTCDYDSDDNNFPRSETPSSTTRRNLLWNSFFGISLTRRSSSFTSTPPHSSPFPDRKGSTSTSDHRTNSPRKHSFRLVSRPTTPKFIDSPTSIPTPSGPLPLSASPRRRSFGLGSSQRGTPKSSVGHLPLSHVQALQAGRANGRRHSAGSERPPHDSAVALPEEPSHRTIRRAIPDGQGQNKTNEYEKLFADQNRPIDILRPSFGTPFSPDPSPPSRSHPSSRHPVFHNLPAVDSASSDHNEQPSHRLHVIPQITHTPPTPQRPGEDIDSPLRALNKGKAVPTAHRGQVLVQSSHSLPDTQHTPSSKGRFTPRFLSISKAKDNNEQKSGKRPLVGPFRNMTSHRGKLGSFDFERPVSALNKSTSTVNQHKLHVQTDNSSKTRLPPLQRTMSNDSTRDGKSYLVVGSPMSSQSKPDHTGSTSVISFSSISLQTKSTEKDTGSSTPAGQSSSWGRASGRHVLRTSHGTSAFEHPSSLSSSPNPHTFNLLNEPNQNGLFQSQPTAPLHAVLDAGAKYPRGPSYNTSNGASSNSGERKPKGKGRSLDLGLGLSWAPSRLREEILMPGFILTREKTKVDTNRTNGLDVTKMFERLLSESQFQAFKNHVRRFDAHAIPLKGPFGLLACVEKLLAEAGLDERERSTLMTEFSVFVESYGG